MVPLHRVNRIRRLQSIDISFLVFLLFPGAFGPHVFGSVGLVPFFRRQKHGDVLEANLIFWVIECCQVFTREIRLARVVLMRAR